MTKSDKYLEMKVDMLQHHTWIIVMLVLKWKRWNEILHCRGCFIHEFYLLCMMWQYWKQLPTRIARPVILPNSLTACRLYGSFYSSMQIFFIYSFKRNTGGSPLKTESSQSYSEQQSQRERERCTSALRLSRAAVLIFVSLGSGRELNSEI